MTDDRGWGACSQPSKRLPIAFGLVVVAAIVFPSVQPRTFRRRSGPVNSVG